MTPRVRKRPVLWSAIKKCEVAPVFGPGAIMQLQEKIGRPLGVSWTAQDVERELNNLALGFALERFEETNPDETPRTGRAKRVADAFDTILREVGAANDDAAIDPSFGKYGLFRVAHARGGEAAVMTDLHAVRLLAVDARALANISALQKRLHPRRKGPAPEAAIKRLVAGLSKLYFEAWASLPGITRSWTDSVVSGPFVTLLSAVHRTIHSRGLDNMIREEGALVQIWNRLSDEERF